MTDHIHAPDLIKVKPVRGSGGTWVVRDELAAIGAERRALMAALAKVEWMLERAIVMSSLHDGSPGWTIKEVMADLAANYDDADHA